MQEVTGARRHFFGGSGLLLGRRGHLFAGRGVFAGRVAHLLSTFAQLGHDAAVGFRLTHHLARGRMHLVNRDRNILQRTSGCRGHHLDALNPGRADVHCAGHFPDLLSDKLDGFRHFFSRAGAGIGQSSDLLCYHGEAPTVLPSPGGFDRRIERQQVGLR